MSSTVRRCLFLLFFVMLSFGEAPSVPILGQSPGISTVIASQELDVQPESVDWGTVYPGTTASAQLDITNTVDADVLLTLGTANWSPPEAEQYMNLSWDYDNRTLPSTVSRSVNLILSVSPDIENVDSFSFDILVEAETQDYYAEQYVEDGVTYTVLSSIDLVQLEFDYDDDGFPDIVSIVQSYNGTHLHIYVHETRVRSQGYRWACAIDNVTGFDEVGKWEYNLATDVWTYTGLLDYAYLPNYGMSPDWGNASSYGFVVFGSGSGDKEYILNFTSGYKEIKIWTGQGSEVLRVKPEKVRFQHGYLDVDVYSALPNTILWRWSREDYLEFSYDLTQSIVGNSFKKGVLTQNYADYDLLFYVGENNDLEFEIVYNSQPASNVLTFPLNDPNLLWYYQGPLDQVLDLSEYDLVNSTHAIKDGNVTIYRPENVVGSYAVYHLSKKNNQYMAGKAFHLYRSRLVDDSGNEAWANLSKAGNELFITLPQDFLDSATYPVVLDPSFGYTDIGETEHQYPHNNLRATKFACPQAGTVTEMHVYAGYNGSPYQPSVSVGIYTDDAGPDDMLESTGDVIVGGAAAWRDYQDFDTSVTATDYWLAQNANNYQILFYYDDGDENQHIENGETYQVPMGDPWDDTSETYFARVYSIYANYTVSGGTTYTTTKYTTVTTTTTSGTSTVAPFTSTTTSGTSTIVFTSTSTSTSGTSTLDPFTTTSTSGTSTLIFTSTSTTTSGTSTLDPFTSTSTSGTTTIVFTSTSTTTSGTSTLEPFTTTTTNTSDTLTVVSTTTSTSGTSTIDPFTSTTTSGTSTQVFTSLTTTTSNTTTLDPFTSTTTATSGTSTITSETTVSGGTSTVTSQTTTTSGTTTIEPFTSTSTSGTVTTHFTSTTTTTSGTTILDPFTSTSTSGTSTVTVTSTTTTTSGTSTLDPFTSTTTSDVSVHTITSTTTTTSGTTILAPFTSTTTGGGVTTTITSTSTSTSGTTTIVDITTDTILITTTSGVSTSTLTHTTTITSTITSTSTVTYATTGFVFSSMMLALMMIIMVGGPLLILLIRKRRNYGW